MPDNFTLLEAFCRHNVPPLDDDLFLYGQIIARKKDGPENAPVKTKVIRDLIFRRLSDFENKKYEIVGLCKVFNARAYLNVNPRSFRRIAIDMVGNCLSAIQNGQESAVIHAFSSACGRAKGVGGFWVVDVDDITIGEEVRQLVPEGGWTTPTVNGVHILTKGFDPRPLKEKFPQVEIHKNNPTLLYAP